ncbi:MAG: FAD:protein FMN transferase [Chloroflexi bacterium]|nr:FAD:protein FMN transferase [Chloroflexota bacterium]
MNPHWASHTFRRMGSQITLWLEGSSRAEWLFAEAAAIFAGNEQIFSRFLPDSELSQVNRQAGKWTAVSQNMWDVLLHALYWAEMTNGLFDPTLLPALQAAGYDRTFTALSATAAQPTPTCADAPTGQWRQIRLDEKAHSIWLPPDARLDLGGLVKGYTARQVADLLSPWGACLVDAGGDLTAGAAPEGLPGWPVAVAAPAPFKSKPALAHLWVAQASLATSGVDYRRWVRNGRAAHHLIHPTTGQPAETDLLTATILAADAVAADVLATISVISGRAAAQHLLETNQVPAHLVTESGEIYTTTTWAHHAHPAQNLYQRRA